MRYEASLIVRVALALALFLLPAYFLDANLFQKAFEEVTFKTVYFFLEKSGAEPRMGAFSVSYAINIFNGEATINVVKYCVTASAYYLLALFCIITMGIAFWKRVAIFILGSAFIFAMNIARIIILIITLLSNNKVFDAAHFMLGLLLSVAYVVLIWVLLSMFFKVHTIPFYSDMKLLVEEAFSKGRRPI